MTDAALPVTERAVERFTEEYLMSLGATITKEGRQWLITLPEDADTDLELNEATLEITEDPDNVSDGSLAISPESPFVERMLDEAADRTPVGSLSLTSDQLDIEHPTWITEGSVEVENSTFTPYYDRRAVCVLFHVGIETVSEYQRDDLHAIAIDLNNHEVRPQLVETYLEVTNDEQPEINEGSAVDERIMQEPLDVAREALENEILSVVRDTRERATRAAEVELDEYRQLVNQRRDEVAEEIDRLTEQIEDVTETIETVSNQEKRVEALRRRKELQAELDDLRAELDDLSFQIEAGFPEKSRKIWDRHALTVRISPVTATKISYERGDLDLRFRDGQRTVSTSYAYAVGAGVMEEVTCEECGQLLSAENPLSIDRERVIGTTCCDG